MELDLDLIQKSIQIAGNAGGSVEKISRALSAFKKMFNSSEVSADTNIKLALAEMAEQVADAKLTNADLKIQLAALHDEIVQSNNFERELDRFEL